MNETELSTFIAGCAIGGLLSWFIAHRYYLRASADQCVALKDLSDGLKPRNTLRDFEILLTESTWAKVVVGHSEVWMADADNTFQIEQGESTRDFREQWTTVYPDPNSSTYPVYLKINGTTIKELTFVSMDGGRIFVPITGVRKVNGDAVERFWNLNSLEVKVCRIIGTYYLYENLEGIARMSKVALAE